LTKAIKTGQRQLDLGERVADVWEAEFALRHSKYTAFIPIIEGCNKFCTYCIVPYSRGRERSRSVKSIIEEILELKESGVKEVCLIGQNVNSYRPLSDEGFEGYKGATPFAKLLRAVAATGIERVKFTTSFPRDFHTDIVSAIEEHENLCEWVHLPVQSGSDNVLKLMRRGYSGSFYLNLVEHMRASSRDISLTTDIIVGFPGESDNDFRDTLELIEKCQFEGAYIFKYSERQGTPAQFMPDEVPEKLKTERFLAVEETQKSVQRERYKRFVGRTLKVLVEKESPRVYGQLSGHSTCQKVVNFNGPVGLIGKIVKVHIIEAKENCLLGELSEVS
jgi:tRNA-2-methylthio-N6-dimethylallyladenosine synthase